MLPLDTLMMKQKLLKTFTLRTTPGGSRPVMWENSTMMGCLSEKSLIGTLSKCFASKILIFFIFQELLTERRIW